jgi:DNA repair ATPase RecN
MCRVNDTNMPVKALRALGQLLVDFNGQGGAIQVESS